MKTMELKVARIGNSRGIRLPADTLRRYHIIGAVLMEERSEGIFLHPKSPPAVEKLSWEETSRQMAASQEDWSAWDAVASDGLAEIPWQRKTSVVADRRSSYGTKPPRTRKTRKRAAL